MEQKKTIWIAVATGLFLLVVVGAAVGIYAPKKNKDNNTVWISQALPEDVKTNHGQIVTTTHGDELAYTSDITPVNAEELKANENQTASEQVPGFGAFETAGTQIPAQGTPSVTDAVAHADNLTVIANGTTTIYGLNPVPQASQNTVPQNITQSVTIDLNTESNIRAVNEKTQKELDQAKTSRAESIASAQNVSDPARTASVSEPSKTVTEKTVETKSSSTTSAPSETKTVTSSKTTTAKTASTSSTGTSVKATASVSAKTTATVSTEKKPDMFWVQAASYTSKKKADEARSILDENKIQCEVFTFTDAKGTMFYRVRTGPYSTKAEAQYWKSNLDKIDQFKNAGSYITNSSAKAIK